MKNRKQIEKIWKANFLESELVKNNELDLKLSKSLFRGIGTFPDSLSDLKCGIRDFANNIEYSKQYFTKISKFLKVFGIILDDTKLQKQIKTPKELEELTTRVFLLYKTIFYAKNDFNIYDPYSNNYGELNFFLRLRIGGNHNINDELFDNPNQIHNQYIQLPEGYEKDTSNIELFNKIEQSNKSFLITGKAGTGKSTFIHYLTKKTKKKTLLLSFTGIAAVNIGGQTIHSFFGFPFKPMLPEDSEIPEFKEHWSSYKIIRDIETIIIDEISMLRSDILEAIDYSLKINGGDTTKPFGGKQIIFVGDPYQLPPIVELNEINKELFTKVYPSEYFFDSPAYIELMPEKVELDKIHRQKNIDFINLLNNVRDYSITEKEIKKINDKCFKPSLNENTNLEIRLSTNKFIAMQENNRRLDLLIETEHIYEAEITGEFNKEKCPAPHYLNLKKNAQIMFIKNDSQNENRKWINGTIGKIHFINKDIIEVELKNGDKEKIEKVEWENRKYKWNKKEGKITSEVIGTFRQFPLKLAWAITIHKSQGLTFDKVRVDLGRGTFTPGQLYTSLSRCSSLNGLSLVRPISITDIIKDERIIEFDKENNINVQNFVNKPLINNALNIRNIN